MTQAKVLRKIGRYRRRMLDRRRPMWRRAGGIGGLVALPGPEAEQALFEGLADPDPRVRFMVAVAMSHRDPPVAPERVVTRLRELQGRPHAGEYRAPDACELIELGLEEWSGLPAVDIAIAGLRDGDATQRRCAVEILRSRHDSRADAALAQAVDDDDAVVRARAREAIDER
jgi:HEAT repeat protein